VTVKAQAAEKVKNQVQKVKDKAQVVVDAIEADKVVVKQKLEAARPALKEAERALNTIKPSDIAVLRKVGRPPHLIQRIMDCVLLLMRRRMDAVQKDPERDCIKPSWAESLKVRTSHFITLQNSFQTAYVNNYTTTTNIQTTILSMFLSLSSSLSSLLSTPFDVMCHNSTKTIC